MTVRDTPGTGTIGRLDAVRCAAPVQRPLQSVRRLPAPADWPFLAILGAQIGILVAIIALWEIAADTGALDAFFWSKPSAIAFFKAARASPSGVRSRARPIISRSGRGSGCWRACQAQAAVTAVAMAPAWPSGWACVTSAEALACATSSSRSSAK